jgi:hypothetical protein
MDHFGPRYLFSSSLPVGVFLIPHRLFLDCSLWQMTQPRVIAKGLPFIITEQSDQEEKVYYLGCILTSAYNSQQVKQNSDVDMKFSTTENVEKLLEELACLVKVQISVMQRHPYVFDIDQGWTISCNIIGP